MITQDQTHAPGQVDVVDFVRMVWRARLPVIVATLLFAIASIYYALTVTPMYRADTVVARVEEGALGGAASLTSQLGALGGLPGLNFTPSGPGRESQAILESRKLVETFITRYSLLPELQPSEGEPASLWKAVKRFRETVLTVRESAAEGLTTVSMKWRDPETAARWANDFVALANEVVRSRAVEKSQRNVDYLNQQIEETDVADLHRVLYRLIENEMKTLMLANAMPDYAFAVVDPAVAPEVRTSPRRKLIVVSATFVGFVVGVVFAFVLDLLRQVRRRGNAA